MTTNREEHLTVIVIGLVALLALNYIGDFTYRGAVNEHIDNSNHNFQVMVNVSNINVERVDGIVGNISSIDKDVKSNYRIIDQLIGIILRDDI